MAWSTFVSPSYMVYRVWSWSRVGMKVYQASIQSRYTFIIPKLLHKWICFFSFDLKEQQQQIILNNQMGFSNRNIDAVFSEMSMWYLISHCTALSLIDLVLRLKYTGLSKSKKKYYLMLTLRFRIWLNKETGFNNIFIVLHQCNFETKIQLTFWHSI